MLQEERAPLADTRRYDGNRTSCTTSCSSLASLLAFVNTAWLNWRSSLELVDESASCCSCIYS